METEKNKPKKTILVVHAGNLKKRFTFYRIKKMGVRIICLHREKVPALQAVVDHWIIAETNNHKECLEGVKSFLNKNPKIKIDGAITFWDEMVLLVSKITDQFGLIGIPYSISRRVKNKFLFREFCKEHGLRAPRHKIIQEKEDITAIEKGMAYPLVIKPIYGDSSAFVMRVNNRAELEESFDYAKNSIRSFSGADEWQNTEFLVEEFIDGDEVDIDILLQNGKIKFYCISDNYNKNRDKFFVDSGQAIPSGLPDKDQQALIDMAEEILEKLGILNACIHFEAKISKNGPYPIEVNMRLGGDYIYSYIKGSYGIDFVEQIVKIALGEYIKIEKLENPHKYIVGWDLHAEHSGILVELDVDEELKNKKYFEEIHFFKEIGDAILRPPEGYDNLGWVTISGDNLLDAQDNLKEALKYISFKVAEFDEESTLGKTDRQSHLSAAKIKRNLLLAAAKMEKVRHASLKTQRQLHIGVAANLSELNHEEYKFNVARVVEELVKRGYNTTLFDFNDLFQSLKEIKRNDVDLVFNLCENSNNNPLKYRAAAVLEAMRIPFTGTSATNLALCRDKIRFKKLLDFHDIPTPKWDYAYTLSDKINDELKYPLIVKPSNTDDSVGITNKSVVTNKKELSQQLKRVIVDMGKPALVEEYVEGDEYAVNILGSQEEDLRALPLSRSVFKKMPAGYWHIYTRESKNKNNKAYSKIISQNPLKNVSKKLESLMTEISLDTYKIMRCHDYGKVDIRVDKDDNPYILELDPNPIIDQRTSLCQVAKIAGMEYGDLIEEIISLSIKRYRDKKMYYKYLE